MPAAYGTPLYLLKRVLWLNASGVDLFFVLSGFLIGGILIDQRESANLLSIFWLRRVARIVPLFVVFLLSFVALSRWPDPPLLTGNSHPLWAHAFFLSNIWMAFAGAFDVSMLASTWSLAIEEQVYLVLPFAVLWIPSRFLRPALVWLVILSPLVRCMVWLAGHGSLSLAAHGLTICRMDAFAVGILIAVEQRAPRPFWRRFSLRQIAFGGFLLALPLAWLTRRNEWMGSLLYCAVGYTFCALFYGWLVVMTFVAPAFSRVCSWLPLTWVGRHSYFIYLFQGIVLAATWRLGAFFFPGPIAQLWILLSASLMLIGASVLSMRWLEAPILRAAHRAKYRPAPVDSLSTPPIPAPWSP